MPKMKFRIFFALLAAMCAVGGYGQAYWPATLHDFGVINEDDGAVGCTFTVVNRGDKPMAIISARATCGCTQPEYSSRPVAPGDSASLSVTFNPQLRPGRFNKQITVETTFGKTRLDIVGVVVGSESTVAQRFPADFGALKMSRNGIMLGEIVKGRFKTVYAEGYNRSTDSLYVEVVAQPRFVDIVPAPNPAAPGEQVSLIAYVNSDKTPLYGLVEDSVTISTAPGVTYTMPITLMIKEDFSTLTAKQTQNAPRAIADSETVDFGRIDRNGAAVSRSFSISNAGKDQLRIRRVYSSDPGVTATLSTDAVKRGKNAVVTVTIDPAVQTGALLNSRLTVITNDPLRPTFTIRLVGTY